MKMSQAEFAEFSKTGLEEFTGRIVIHSPVKIGGTKAPTDHTIDFHAGRGYVDHRGKAAAIGEMQFGVFMLFRFGVRNECLRHLLFPGTLLLERPVLVTDDDREAADRITVEQFLFRGNAPCRFPSFKRNVLAAGIDSITYDVLPRE